MNNNEKNLNGIILKCEENERKNRKKNKNILKKNNGVITLFVLISMLFFIFMASALYTNMSNKKISIVEDVYNIESEYYVSDNNLTQTYDDIVNVAVESWNSEKGVNSPAVESGMIPIKWNGTTWVICSEEDDNWYNYEDQTTIGGTNSMWANIMLSDGTYKSDTAIKGTSVAAEDLRKYVRMDTTL